MGFADYLKLMRFNFHISFITVILGALLYSQIPDFHLLKSIILCYVFFNILLYGGIYTFNAINDLEDDSKDKIKKFRPLPAGKVSVKSAIIFAIILILSGLFLSYFFLSRYIFFIFLIFLLLNIFYNIKAKKTVYLNLLVVSSTHTMRLFLGMTLAGAKPDILFLAAFYIMIFGIAVTIHGIFNKKKNEERFYTKKLIFYIQSSCFIVALIMFSLSEKFVIPWIIALLFYFLLVTLSKIHSFRPYIARLFMIKLKA